jgi:hypothetical protein
MATAGGVGRGRSREGSTARNSQAAGSVSTVRWIIAVVAAVAVLIALVVLVRSELAIDRRPVAEATRLSSVFVSPGPADPFPVVAVASSAESLEVIWSRWQVPGSPPRVEVAELPVAIWGGGKTGGVDVLEFRWDGSTLVALGTVAREDCPRLAVVGAPVEVWSIEVPEEVDRDMVMGAVETSQRASC